MDWRGSIENLLLFFFCFVYTRYDIYNSFNRYDHHALMAILPDLAYNCLSERRLHSQFDRTGCFPMSQSDYLTGAFC